MSAVLEDSRWIVLERVIWSSSSDAGKTRPEEILPEADAVREICGGCCKSVWIQPSSNSLYVAEHGSAYENWVESGILIEAAMAASATRVEQGAEYEYPTLGEVHSSYVPCHVRFRRLRAPSLLDDC